MINYDMHIHTEYCGHAEGMVVSEIIDTAERNGLDTIAITDHIFSPSSIERIERIRAEAGRVQSKCKVIIGAEIDVDPMHTDGRFVIEQIEKYDYVLAGLHYVPTVGNYAHSPEDASIDPEEIFSHWRTTLLGIVSNKAVTALAHPGRMIGTAVRLEDYFEDMLSVYEEAANLSAENNVAWELNELTANRLTESWQSQWYKIYEIALDHGVKIIYGSDAHSLGCIGLQEFAGRVLAKLPEGALSRPEDLGY